MSSTADSDGQRIGRDADTEEYDDADDYPGGDDGQGDDACGQQQ